MDRLIEKKKELKIVSLNVLCFFFIGIFDIVTNLLYFCDKK